MVHWHTACCPVFLDPVKGCTSIVDIIYNKDVLWLFFITKCIFSHPKITFGTVFIVTQTYFKCFTTDASHVTNNSSRYIAAACKSYNVIRTPVVGIHLINNAYTHAFNVSPAVIMFLNHS